MGVRQEIRKIQERNKRVEADKAWETSNARKALIAVFTYAAIGAYLNAINVSDAWLNAIVPTVAFLLSTLTMPWFKRLWIKRFVKG